MGLKCNAHKPYPAKTALLKSDQNGIEIRACGLFKINIKYVKIRPKWD